MFWAKIAIFFIKSYTPIKKDSYICDVDSCRKPKGGRDKQTYKIRRYLTLCSWRIGIWSFQKSVKAKQRWCLRIMYKARTISTCVHIRGLSALLVSDRWARPKPQYVGRATSKFPRFCFIWVNKKQIINNLLRGLAEGKQKIPLWHKKKPYLEEQYSNT